jgi:hypothetical protein
LWCAWGRGGEAGCRRAAHKAAEARRLRALAAACTRHSHPRLPAACRLCRRAGLSVRVPALPARAARSNKSELTADTLALVVLNFMRLFVLRWGWWGGVAAEAQPVEAQAPHHRECLANPRCCMSPLPACLASLQVARLSPAACSWVSALAWPAPSSSGGHSCITQPTGERGCVCVCIGGGGEGGPQVRAAETGAPLPCSCIAALDIGGLEPAHTCDVHCQPHASAAAAAGSRAGSCSPLLAAR